MSQLNLDLPDAGQSTGEGPKSGLISGIIVLLLLACLVGIWKPKKNEANPETTDFGLSQEAREEVILKLKKSGAYSAAAKLLGEMAVHSSLSQARRAKIYKHQGDLHSQANDLDQALLSYYKAEFCANGESEKIKNEISKAIVEALQNKGEFTAVSSTLARINRKKQGKNTTTHDAVVAEFDGEKVLMSEYELYIKDHIDAETRRLSEGKSDSEEIERIKSELKKQYSAPYEKLQYLSRWLMEEILYREAQQWKIDQHPEYSSTMNELKRQVMRNLLIREKVQIKEVSDIDLKNYAESNKEKLGLSTEPGSLNEGDFASVRAQAELAYRQEKMLELGQKYQTELWERHQVQIKREAFSEGAGRGE